VIQSLASDLRYGTRLLRQSPVFGAIAVIALALGIGANTAIFSTVHALLLRALPFADPDRLVMVWEDVSWAGFPKNTPAPGNFADWKAQNRVFTDMAATRGGMGNLTADGAPEQVQGRLVTANFFDVLGVRPLLGRAFTADEDRQGAPVVLISYGLWQRRYAGDPAIVNRTMRINGLSVTVIGVMPRDFAFRDREVAFWSPIHFTPSDLQNHGSHYLNVVARLKPGIPIERAREEMAAIAKRIEQQHPNDNRNVGTVVVPIREDMLGDTRLAVLVLMGAAGCVLLIACANLANLLLARAVARQREIAVRAALGAGRGRLIRQMVTEGVLLSLIGGVLGLAVARVGMAFLSKLMPAAFALADQALDTRLLLFTFAVSLLTGLLFSIVPALQASRASLNDALRQGGRGGIGGRRATTRDALVVLEVAAALVLLVGAGLMLKTLARLRAIDIGFRSDHLLTLRTTLPRNRYADPAKRLAFFQRVMEGVRALPGVETASYNNLLPFLSIGNTQGYTIDGITLQPGTESDALLRVGDPDYLKCLGVRLIEGRLPDARDGATAPRVIVINETFAKRYWPKATALGHRIRMHEGGVPIWRTVIGVVQDVRERGYELAMKPGVYIPYTQYVDTWAQPEMWIVRTKGDPAALAGAVRRVIAEVDPEQPVAAVRTFDEILDRNVADRARQMTLLGAFAGLALLLASIGLYGVLSYAVTQRSREIGLRMALGASARGVVGIVVGRGLALAGAGLLIGLGTAAAATRAMKTMLYGVDAIDPATFAAVSGLLLAISALACWVPAWRASRVEPIVVLRDE
jgi:putative ABC transport system permease protein